MEIAARGPAGYTTRQSGRVLCAERGEVIKIERER